MSSSVMVRIARVRSDERKPITGVPVLRGGRRVNVEFDPLKDEFEVPTDVAEAALNVKFGGKTGYFVMADPKGVKRIGSHDFRTP